MKLGELLRCSQDGHWSIVRKFRDIGTIDRKLYQSSNEIVKFLCRHVRKGHNLVLDKIEEARRDFQRAKTMGSRSCSGKIVLAHFVTLNLIFDDSSNIETFGFGIESTDFFTKAKLRHST